MGRSIPILTSMSTDTYFGRPCKEGHTLRRADNHGCIECARVRSAQYAKKNSKIVTARAIAWAKANPQRVTEISRKHRGLPPPTRPEPKFCENCGNLPGGRGGKMHLDRDKVTGKFRGWLCFNCNTSIGKLGDNIAGLLRALGYLLNAS